VKRFYLLWFFLCAGWGYLMSAFRGFAQDGWFATLAAGAVTSFLILSVILWRLPHGARVLPPSLSLKPWTMPFGLSTFLWVTFLFSSLWGMVFAYALPNNTFEQPFQFVTLSVGGLLGLRGACFAFPSKIQRSAVA
jgi:hypothetical protein